MNKCKIIRELKREVEYVLNNQDTMSKFEKKSNLLRIRKKLVDIIINPESCYKCINKSKDLMKVISVISLN